MHDASGVILTAPDYVQGLQTTIEAIQLLVPDISFSAGVSQYEVYASVPRLSTPFTEHKRRLKRPAAIAEALKMAFLGNIEDGDFDHDAPAMTGLWLGQLSAALITVNRRFPYYGLEFGYGGGLVWAKLLDLEQKRFVKVCTKYVHAGSTLYDAVTGVEALYDADYGVGDRAAA